MLLPYGVDKYISFQDLSFLIFDQFTKNTTSKELAKVTSYKHSLK